MRAIKEITSEEILDSRGIPTLKTTVQLDGGAVGEASVPSGTSVGSYEARELRDGDLKRFNGKGVLKAIENVNSLIAPVLKGKDALSQAGIDDILLELDGTKDKSKLGANATLSVSLAVARAAAKSKGMEVFQHLGDIFEIGKSPSLPTPMINLINGGKHAESGVDFQEFLAIPFGFKTFREKFEAVKKVIDQLKILSLQEGLTVSQGLEGGLALNLKKNEDALVLLKKAVDLEGFSKEIGLGVDIAATMIYQNGKYHIRDLGTSVSGTDFINFLRELSSRYSLISIEDPLFEDDWDGWQKSATLLSPTIVVADDLVATNIERLNKLIEYRASTGVVVKPNQVGTLTETVKFLSQAKNAGLKIVVSHRSGDTDDSFISDLAVAARADFIKSGSPQQTERLVKYTRLLEIEKII